MRNQSDLQMKKQILSAIEKQLSLFFLNNTASSPAILSKLFPVFHPILISILFHRL